MTPVQRDLSVEARLREMIRHISGHKHDFPASTELYADLFIAGDDAFELLEMVSKEFGTSFRGLKFEFYFPNETDALWSYLWCKLSRRRPRFRSFAFGHLLMVVQQGHWFEPSVRA